MNSPHSFTILLTSLTVCVLLASASSSASQTVTGSPSSASCAFTEQNISFPSFPAPSGQITLHGTIYLPSSVSSSAPAPAVVMIHGSGPNDRYEDIGTVRPFYDVGRYLARLGFVVLLYDKRTCTAAAHPICQYRYCSASVKEDCVQAADVVVDDFALDARAALAYLRTRDEVDSERLVLFGHSQGCDLAPGVAAVEHGVGHVILLMGSGVPVDQTATLQAERQRALYMDQMRQWELKKPSPLRTRELTALNRTIAAYNCTIQYATPQYDLLRNGVLELNQNAVICPYGVYWDGGGNVPEGLYCPAACGNGVCATHENNTLSCLTHQCNPGEAIGCCIALPFSSSWMNATTPERRLADLSAVRGKILAVNSWTDLLIPPAAFQPLHRMLTQELVGNLHYYLPQGNLGPVTQSAVRVVANITHDLTAYPPTSSMLVVQPVLETVSSFLSEDFDLNWSCYRSYYD
mmetsp:Transcript_25114/g.63128  ORF Transcript_25114/g.63128 Transcript_25114/m.63128 type:complete len:463 (+) Transcript_25114:1313-2701(+)